MKLRNPLPLAVYGLLLIFLIISWCSVLFLDQIAVVPLGLCPVLVMAGSMGSLMGLVFTILVVALIYGWIFFSIWGVSKRRRFGTVGLVILLTLDLGANIVFSAVSWWYLVAVVLDLLLVALCYLLYRKANINKRK